MAHVKPSYKNRRYNVGSFPQIYFIKGESSNRIKIGVSKNVTRRFKVLQASSGEYLLLMGWTRGGKDLERKIHNKFSNIRAHGEWFEQTDKLKKYIYDLIRDGEKIERRYCTICGKLLSQYNKEDKCFFHGE